MQGQDAAKLNKWKIEQSGGRGSLDQHRGQEEERRSIKANLSMIANQLVIVGQHFRWFCLGRSFWCLRQRGNAPRPSVRLNQFPLWESLAIKKNTTISWSRRSEHQTKQDFFLLRVSDLFPVSQLILHEADTLKSQKRQNHSVSMPRLKKKLINQTKSQNKLISVRGGGVRTTTISERSHSTVE